MSAIFSIKAFSLRWPLKTSNFSCPSILAAFNFSKTKNIAVPVENLVLVNGRLSGDLPPTSYIPGALASPLHFVLPELISNRLREGFKMFDLCIRIPAINA